MLAALLVCAAALLAAGAPGVALAAGDLSAAQDRVDAARLAVRTTALAHALADERDAVAVSAAAGRPALPPADRARTDQAAAACAKGAPAALRSALAGLPATRRAALAAKDPQAVPAAYQGLDATLLRTAGTTTAALDRAVDAASLQRGLLTAALTGKGGQPGLVAAARAARAQEQAGLADFRAAAPPALVTRYDDTVTGATADQAERDTATLLGGPQIGSDGRALGADRVQAALTARLGLMRSVAETAAAEQVSQAAAHRSHTVSVLELRCVLVLLCLLLLVGVLATHFRGITRPLAALHRWARTDSGGQGPRVVGSDEFAVVARRVNQLAQEARTLRGRLQDLGTARTTASAAHAALAAEHQAVLRSRAELLRTRDDLMRSREELAARLNDAVARAGVQTAYVSLSLRTLGLVERQLVLIEEMEEHEQEPGRLAELFRLDHLATRMRRNSENLLVLTGTEHSHGASARPVPLIDVARAALSETERYDRVRITSVPGAQVAGRAADDVSHLVAELLDNAAAFSAPTADVHLAGWVLDSGEVALSVEDSGIGLPLERVADLNALLADPDPAPPAAAAGLGLYVVSRLAHRHGVRVELRPQPAGGTVAVVVLPQVLVLQVDPLGAVVPAQREASPDPGRAPDQGPYQPAGQEAEPFGEAPVASAPEVPVGVWQERPLTPAEATSPYPTPPSGISVPGYARPAAPADPPTDPAAPAAAPPVAPAVAVPPAPVGPADPAEPSQPPVSAEHSRAQGEPEALPRRVRQATGMHADRPGAAAARREPPDPNGLRRQLAGLQRGLAEGRRDAELEARGEAASRGTARGAADPHGPEAAAGSVPVDRAAGSTTPPRAADEAAPNRPRPERVVEQGRESGGRHRGTAGPEADPGAAVASPPAAPGSTAPGPRASDATVPGAAAPGLAPSGSTAPGRAPSGAAAHGAAAPGAAAPGPTAPGAAARPATAPRAAAPGAVSPAPTSSGTRPGDPAEEANR